jgi:hypothetical protein
MRKVCSRFIMRLRNIVMMKREFTKKCKNFHLKKEGIFWTNGQVNT